MSELSAEGLVIDTYDDLVESMGTDWVDRTGVSADAVAEDAPDGILIRIVAERIAAVNDLTQAVFSSLDRDAATGAALVTVAALTGTLQEPPRSSTVDLLLAGTNLTAIATGKRASAPSTDTNWETTEDVTLATATSWAGTTGYALRDVVTNDGKVYRCITAGTSAGSGGPDTEDDDVTDGSVHWAFVGTGDAIATATAAATVTGPKTGAAYTIIEIETPVSGWTGVVNLADAELGNDLESDPDLRVRSADELEAQGASTPEAVRAELLKVEDVESVTVFYNNTDVTDGNGLPPHSTECMVQGGADQDIWDQLWLSVPVGIATFGDEEGTTDDSQGTAQTMRFSRPDLIPIYIEVTVEVDADLFPSDGEDQIKAAIAAFGDTFEAGRNVRARSLGAVTVGRLDGLGNQLGVAGVLEALTTKIKASAGPTVETPIAISTRQRATFDTGNITVVVVEVVP